MKNPKISIVTVTYNAESILEKTILSVINQDYDNIEYIVIDGGSTDGTIEVIKKHQDKISFWLSEPDKGIYDAMNKGINRATGDWINFMNAGDLLYSENVLTDIFVNNGPNIVGVDVIYGNTIYDYYSYSYMEEPGNLETLKFDKNFSHQSAFARTVLMKKYKFNSSLKICSDFQFFYILYQNHCAFLYLPIIISVFLGENSTSGTHKILTYRERSIINQESKSFFWIIKYFKFILRMKMGLAYRSFFSEKKLIEIRKKRLFGNKNVKWIKIK